jgi:DNA-directed RNA polymerase subunit M/transcription elongation factor TFIIS
MDGSFCERCENFMTVGSIGSVLIKTCSACGFQKRGDTEYTYTIKRSSRHKTIAAAHPLHYLDPCLPRIMAQCPGCQKSTETVVYVANSDGARGLTCTVCETRYLA